ncbi:MAG: response regulator [Chloroflexi bacterium]|nr:response regulator [Chloroflexota bacterium]
MSKLLIVDDEAATVDMLSTYLDLIGHETVGAFSGEEGLTSVYSEDPDLLILDLMMPDLEGFDVCKRLRESGDYTALPILIISARFDQQSIDRAMGLGADSYLTKPIDLPKLTSEIMRLLENPPDHRDRVKKTDSQQPKAELPKSEPETKAAEKRAAPNSDQ